MERRNYESVKYTFNGEEVRELGEALAREAQTVFDLREQKKAATSDFTAKIEAANKRVCDLFLRINNGYELREVECLHMMDLPRPGMKRIIRTDTNETIREEAMTMQEMQGSFGFQEPEKD